MAGSGTVNGTPWISGRRRGRGRTLQLSNSRLRSRRLDKNPGRKTPKIAIEKKSENPRYKLKISFLQLLFLSLFKTEGAFSRRQSWEVLAKYQITPVRQY